MSSRHHTLLVTLLTLLLLPTCSDAGWHGDTTDASVDAGATCGNGVVEEGEECDDGNSDNNDGCCNSCLICNACTVSQWERCTPGESVCCPSAEDVPSECAVHATDPESHRCLRECESAADCYWSNECGPTFDGHCWPTYCGPDRGPDRGTDVNTPCSVADATGYCYPQGSAQDAWGLCIEPGTLPAGTQCERGHTLDEIPRTVETCANGICSAWVADVAPVCMDFCDPINAYDATQVGADACPAGFNCLSMSYISAYSHLRTADKGWCVPTPSTDASGLVSCDLLGSGLIADRSQVCDDLVPGTLCGFWRNGSLMGTCQEFDATGMSLTLGDPCDAAADQPACGESLLCSGMDPFGPADATDFHCLQICDAADPSWICDATDLVCTSLSVAHYTTDVTTDGSPTRLGLCAPPPTPPPPTP